MSIRKGCGKEIIWGVTPDGKRIPLDPRAPVYRSTAVNAADDSEQVERMTLAMVSHFATCPAARAAWREDGEKGRASLYDLFAV